MKKKQVLALAMASAMVFSLTAGQVAFAAQEGENIGSVGIEVTQDADDGAEEKNQESEDQNTEDPAQDQAKDPEEADADGALTEKQETGDSTVDSPEKKVTDADNQEMETQNQPAEAAEEAVGTEEIEAVADAQSEDPVVDSSARTVTYNQPVEITLDANSTVSQGMIYAIGNDDKAPSDRNYTYIYNAPVHVTFDGVTATIGTLIETNYGSGFNTWQFNDTVTIDINNCNFTNFATQGMFLSVSSIFNGIMAPTVQMKGKLTYNITNSTINAIVGGMLKNGSFPGTGFPPVKINSNCQIEAGLDMNISGNSNISAVIAGHMFTSNDTKESTNQTFTMSTANINVDNSTVGGVMVSRAQADKAADRQGDLVLTGDLNVNLKNGAKLTSALIGNTCKFGANDVYLCGEVTGKTTFTADSAQTMAQLRNVDELNLGGAVEVIPATAGTGARMTVKDTGMKLNLTNPDQWKTGDTVLSYKYTDGTYPKVDENKVSSSWSDTSMSLVYGDDTAASTQAWTFKRDTLDVSIKEKDGSADYGMITVNKNDKISWTQIPEAVKKTGYEISGWVKEDGSSWDLDNDAVTESMTVHPVWKLKNPEVTLSTEGNVTEIHAGQTLTLTARATHDGPENIVFSYVWYKDGKEIIDSKESEVAAQAAEGSYSVVVTEAGEYSVKVVATDGNQNSDEVDCGPIAIRVSDHKFDGAWEKNETAHWHVCTVNGCNVRADEAGHTFGEWTVVKAATATVTGSKEAVCAVCGYKKTEVIPALGASKDDTNKDQTQDTGKDPGKDPSKPGDNSGNQSSGSGTQVQETKAVKTGDTSGLGIALACMGLAVGAGASVVVTKKRK